MRFLDRSNERLLNNLLAIDKSIEQIRQGKVIVKIMDEFRGVKK